MSQDDDGFTTIESKFKYMSLSGNKNKRKKKRGHVFQDPDHYTLADLKSVLSKRRYVDSLLLILKHNLIADIIRETLTESRFYKELLGKCIIATKGVHVICQPWFLIWLRHLSCKSDTDSSARHGMLWYWLHPTFKECTIPICTGATHPWFTQSKWITLPTTPLSHHHHHHPRQKIPGQVSIFDPVMTDLDKELCKEHDIYVIDTNEVNAGSCSTCEMVA